MLLNMQNGVEMKIKKFKNIWTMGLILFSAILILFYVAKIFFPDFIIGVAEIPFIVNVGSYIDTHLWAFYLYSFIISFLTGYIYSCACCRKIKLSIKQVLILASVVISLLVIQILLPKIY